MIMPQSRFLEFLVEEARRYPTFSLVMGARVQHLLTEDRVIRGVSYRDDSGQHDVRAPLTVSADGRFSQIRKVAGFEPVRVSGTMEVLWLRLPRKSGEQHDEAALMLGKREVAAVLGRPNEWQVGYVMNKGGFQRLKGDGIDALQRSIAATVPWLADRVSLICDWWQINVLSVEASRVATWHRPGLLLIGDAAHVMLPVGGVGINCAIADAVEAVNVLTEPLLNGRMDESHPAEVQRRRAVHEDHPRISSRRAGWHCVGTIQWQAIPSAAASANHRPNTCAEESAGAPHGVRRQARQARAPEGCDSTGIRKRFFTACPVLIPDF
jgi:2-polyprenyl-6-methoxyphenol hydroxylase-like FAD-dependent oxidoreductase